MAIFDPLSSIFDSFTRTEFLELHLRWLRRGFLCAECLANFQAQQIFGGQVRRKKAYALVILRNVFDVALARDRDAVLSAFQLSLQVAEVLIGFQFGIPFNDDQQSREGARKLALSLFKLLEHLRIVERIGVELY